MEFERIWDSPPFTADFIDGGGGDLVISFASIGHDPARPPAPEFVATAIGRGGPPRRALFISDASRSWANHPRFIPTLFGAMIRISGRAPVRRMVAIGLSMGGFSALVATRFLPVDVVLAFSPQWSVVPGVVPGEARWQDWAAKLPIVRWPQAPLPARGRAYLFHGMADDLEQALRFPPTPGTDHILFPGLSHSGLVPHLKARGALAGLMEAALADDRRRLLRIASSAGGSLRHRVLPAQEAASSADT